MATVNKDFKVKNGLIVEGTTGTIDGNDILTKNQDSDTYIVNLIGGETLVKSVSGNLAVDNAGDLSLNQNSLASDLAGSYLYTNNGDDNLNVDIEGIADDLISQANFATTSDISTALEDYTTTNNLDSTVGGYGYLKSGDLPTMYTDADAVDAVQAVLGDGIEYNGSFNVQVGTGLEINGSNQVAVDRNTVDGWYDESGAAGAVASDLSDHISDTSAHGVTGDVVGTTDSQTLTNKTFDGTINLGLYNTNNAYIQTDNDGAGNLTINAGGDFVLSSDTGNIVINPGDTAYIGSASAGNEIATNSYVDNAVSGLSWKQAVNLLWDDDHITMSGSTGTLALDGHSALTAEDSGYRILTINMGADNGIWVYNDNGTNWSISRPTDADDYSELIGAAVYVMEGTQYGSTSWVQGNHYITNFTGQAWTQFSGQGSVTAGDGITVDGLQVSIDRTTVDTWYDYNGAVSDHNSESTDVHGVSGDVVGTTDSQTLSNKTLQGSTQINPQSGAQPDVGYATIEYIDAVSGDEKLKISAEHGWTGGNVGGNLELHAYNNIKLDTNNGDIVIDADGGEYIGSASSENQIATEGWVQNQTSDTFSEGETNLYYTDSRVKDVLTGATKTNIAITNVDGELIITAENGVADSTTDNLSEGEDNLYFTDGRAKDSAGDLLANATKSNIDITYVNGVLTVTAENGVDDSTTDNLEEGSTNLYFTDQRAVDALENVTPNFTEIDINSIARQVAAQTGNIATPSTNTVYSFAKADYRSAKFLIKTAYGSHTELTEVLLTLDSSDNIAITEYATVGTNGSSMNVSADIDMGNVRLRVQTLNNNSVVTVTGTLLV